jgi:hypothetical protein
MQEFNAKVSYFGLAKSSPPGNGEILMVTLGYAAPEFIMTGLLF